MTVMQSPVEVRILNHTTYDWQILLIAHMICVMITNILVGCVVDAMPILPYMSLHY